ncbi:MULTISPECIES: DUF4296 domain-containing protein [unclassified Siphonobacter]|uniref:DUF4296 domain-containing protein n=1 Tax=unclassified Siphonobacter TaxID=2635712 RepID=UPI00277FDBAD|nr:MULTISPECIES: DUF4296 domain-containing protein [unclassified Siphonobacter]MDQ1087832.1 hypothetical protein [Siphonobacter sp. SORGH_AS_1065]MDR6193977.1 hypothetical protein [Siphonobacter sp. SORGH_AS_0500]
MKTRLLLPLLALLMACSNAPSPPENLIPQDKMVQILKDVHLAEQRIIRLRLGSQDSSMVAFQVLEKDILKKYQADTGTYRASYRYYIAQPDKFKDIYKAVVDSLTVLEEREKKMARADSSKSAQTRPDSTKLQVQ